jgi:hypothetical protein
MSGPSVEKTVLLALSLQRINAQMTAAVIDSIHAEEDTLLQTGSKLLDLTVDLSAVSAQDCPPISHYRIVVRETVWLRRLAVNPGSKPSVGALLALFTTTPDEPIDGAPSRNIRNATAGIIADWKNSLWEQPKP